MSGSRYQGDSPEKNLLLKYFQNELLLSICINGAVIDTDDCGQLFQFAQKSNCCLSTTLV